MGKWSRLTVTGRPPSLQVATLDERLAAAMRRGEFALIDIAAE
jgi:hypothetical protein